MPQKSNINVNLDKPKRVLYTHLYRYNYIDTDEYTAEDTLIYTKPDDNKKAAREPAYLRIEQDIRAKVSDGRLPSGTMLASRHNLAREYGVALSTAQMAIANLIAEGVLETFDRRGTFVARGTRGEENELQINPGGLNSSQKPAQNGAISVSGNGSSNLLSTKTVSNCRLGIVSTALINPVFREDVGSLWARIAIRSLEQVISTSGGTTIFFDRYPDSLGPYPRGFDDKNAISMAEAIQFLCNEGADAIAVVGLCDSRDMSEEILSVLDVDKVPAVYISWHEIPPPLAQVFYDNRYAGYQAAQHLIRSGYQNLVVLKPFIDSWLTERIQGMRDAVRHAGFPTDSFHLYPQDAPSSLYDREKSHGMLRLLAKSLLSEIRDDTTGKGLTGIISPNDDIAYIVLTEAAELGLNPGADFGLVGFDDDSKSYTLGLTTVRPPIEEMGEEAGRLLLKAIHGDKNGLQVRMRAHLIPRASTFLRQTRK